MPSNLRPALQRLASGQRLTVAESTAAFGALMRGEASAIEVAGLLLGLRSRGETAEEIVGAAEALRDAMVRVPLPRNRPCVDTAGTGGGAVTTFNISTAAAFVAAGAGAAVAKHGNRSFTSRCGSADVFEALGVALPSDAASAAAILEQVGMVFLFAPHFHPAMRYAAPVRRELGVTTIFNVVGPLANPAGVRRQVVGVADREQGPLLAHALAQLRAEHALVVHGRLGLDEIAPVGESDIWETRDAEVHHWVLQPSAWGLAARDLDGIRGGEPAENAARLEEVLEAGSSAPGYEAVTLNGAAAIYVAGLADTFEGAVQRARGVLASGAARDVLARLRAATAASTFG